ncbi:MAG: beta-3-deoxy-D-manno-oct-2-ulosonic acid transferase [Idiomarina sp.]|uniref:capsular polysaccharide biosynthesis protein n=1 Tax=Idiomarina sp. TaxID=1874361 RepID=UPI000C60C0E4|nr:capsular polysaccharide biosynthesis protein [Idiomarina sp.]MBT42046.1 beta-3-deoxy-D-manno-oct-2-ulosonic acid transferase [Idiomarina sp.]
MQKPTRLVTVSKALARLPYLSKRLNAQVVYRHRYGLYGPWLPANSQAILAWGKKPSAQAAERVAKRLAKPVLRLEDAFLRSLQLGAESMPLGIVADDSGIYYDASQPSRLEHLIQQPLSEAQQHRAEQLIQRWRCQRLSKYNHCRSQAVDYEKPFVLIVDQTYGDASIRYGNADASDFAAMLAAARQRYPKHLLVIKTHPDVLAGYKQGHFDPAPLAEDPQVVLEARAIHPPDLIEPADALFCVTSQMGFEGLLWGKPVHVFGAPFYAGWGLTDDSAAPLAEVIKRRGKASLQQLVHAAFIDYALYWHPEQQQACEIEALMDWLAQQRQWREHYPAHLLAERFPRWKKPHLQRFFAGTQLRFLKRHAPLPQHQPVVVWGRPQAANQIAVEDGFVRSVGLGADLTAPKSWVIDDLGMYYDATQPSRLEQLLIEGAFSAQELQRAEQLINRLVAENVSKYNVGNDTWQRPKTAQRVILVPGQVESDASIRFGSPTLKTNYALLKAVREQNPSAFVVYKPHPDVVAGLRKKDSQHKQQFTLCDDVVLHDNMASLLTKVDEVHTLTSLTGFEALLRKLPVTCYGQPFYAGWGLTQDINPNERRGYQRSLTQLVAAALIRYPRYLSDNSGTLTTVECALDELANTRKLQQQPSQRLNIGRLLVRLKRQLLRIKRF